MYTTTWEATDPRLSGAVSIVANRDEYERAEMAEGQATPSIGRA